MKWDFSLIKAQGDVKEIEAAIHRHINLGVRRCAKRYQLSVKICEEDAIDSFGSLLTAIQFSGHRLYLLIDEYDNFANEVLMTGRKQDYYEALLYLSLIHI